MILIWAMAADLHQHAIDPYSRQILITAGNQTAADHIHSSRFSLSGARSAVPSQIPDRCADDMHQTGKGKQHEQRHPSSTQLVDHPTGSIANAALTGRRVTIDCAQSPSMTITEPSRCRVEATMVSRAEDRLGQQHEQDHDVRGTGGGADSGLLQTALDQHQQPDQHSTPKKPPDTIASTCLAPY